MLVIVSLILIPRKIIAQNTSFKQSNKMIYSSDNFYVNYSYTNNKIYLSSSIQIRKNTSDVFNFISDVRNDKLWRSEIIKTEIDTFPLLNNSSIIEYTKLSKKQPNHPLVFQIISLQPNKLFQMETIEGSPFWEVSQREVEYLNNGVTQFTYCVNFDAKILKFALGFYLPQFILRHYLKSVTKQYLRKLKNVLEEK